MKKLVLFLFIALLVSCKSKSPIVTQKSKAQSMGIYDGKPIVTENRTADKPATIGETSRNRREAKAEENTKTSTVSLLLNAATQYEGVRYRGGGTTREGMDCSGLVTVAFREINRSLPRSSADMATVGKRINRDKAQVGDLIFFKTSGKGRINHVGIITEIKGDDIRFIHSTLQRGVIFSSVKEPYYQRTFAQINRVIEE